MSGLICDFDDFGANHIISDVCQSNDCRRKLDELHFTNGNFKVTLFAIPAEMTMELLDWCKANESWIQLAVHGFYHRSNYECEKMEYNEFVGNMQKFSPMIVEYFTKGFKAPGWQISEGCYKWLNEMEWWVADQPYNNDRRPEGLKAYVIDDHPLTWHGHCWDCVGNGIYETFDDLKETVRYAPDFKFISEVV